jgi:cellulose biosynthesis protein BcsQ
VPTGDFADVAVKILAVLATSLAGLAAWAWSRHVKLTHLQSEHDALRRDKETLDGKLDETRRLNEELRQSSADRYDKLRVAYHDARDKFYRIKAAALAQREEFQLARHNPIDTGPESKTAKTSNEQQEELDATRQQLDELQRRIEEVTRSDGRIWLRPPKGSVPVFRPRTDRRSVVVSVLNLKGGVGKTTITANLAATFAKAKSPSLLIDLDYQRSLSMLLVNNKDRILLHRAGFSVQHFLSGERHTGDELKKRLKELMPDLPDCAVLTNSDSRSGSQGADGLEETESRLMIEWLFDRTRPDPRFFLRSALHDPAIDQAYRYVFLDCPPRLTTACVSALAASDYVLIPVVPDPLSTRAVENLLTTLQSLRDKLCPELRILAVVPNMVRVHQGEPIRAHADALVELKAAILERWDEPIRITEAFVKHDSAFGIAAAELDTGKKLRLAISDAKVAQCFDALARELEREMNHHASRRSPAVSAKPAARARSGR